MPKLKKLVVKRGRTYISRPKLRKCWRWLMDMKLTYKELGKPFDRGAETMRMIFHGKKSPDYILSELLKERFGSYK
jgi:hypothetical protein